MAGDRTIAKDDAFHVLQNPRRRAALRYMLDRSEQEQFTMRELAEEVAAWEHDTVVERLTSDQGQRVYIGFYQNHLPKLADYGVIEYDRNRGTVEPTPLLAVFRRYVGDGLHDADDHLTVPAEAGESEGTGLTTAVTGLFSK